MLEWANRGINLWTVEERTQTLTAATATYTLDADIIDLLDHSLRTDAGDTSAQVDYTLTRISVSTWAERSNKLSSGRPTEIYVDRARAAPAVTVWPVPDSAQTYTLAYWCVTRIDDAGAYSNTADLPARFLPALIAGMAFTIAMKDPKLQGRVPTLKAIYEEQFELAASEDREKAPLVFVPPQDLGL
jgi:hypothetical protein